MTLTTRQYWAACAGVEGIGRQTFARILAFKKDHHLSWPEVWASVVACHSALKLTPAQAAAVTAFAQRYTVASYFDWLQSQQIQVLTIRDKEYPFLLTKIDDKPFVLFTQGAWNWGRAPVAIVGTRRATPYGRLVTQKLSRELAVSGATIVSGFMYGVDTIAHAQALASGAKTVGVLGYGFNHRFPSSHAPLYDQFLAQGMTFITEYPPSMPAYPGNFPLRNRLVAGMSFATVVTEAGADSGSLITARLAVEYNRVVCAVPGAITSPHAEGTKWLINEGATFVSKGEEVLAEIRLQLGGPLIPGENADPQRASERQAELEFTNDLQRQLYHYLLSQPLTPEELVAESHRPFLEVITELSLMELEGLIVRSGEAWHIKQ